MAATPVIHVGGGADRPEVARAVDQGGGRTGPLEKADGVVWLGGDPAALPRLPDSVRWLQLPSAGVEQWLASGLPEGDRTVTSAVGVFGLPVADRFLELCEVGDYDPYWDIVAALGGFDDATLARWTPVEEEFLARAVARR